MQIFSREAAKKKGRREARIFFWRGAPVEIDCAFGAERHSRLFYFFAASRETFLGASAQRDVR
jgi:hypothetical protein